MSNELRVWIAIAALALGVLFNMLAVNEINKSLRLHRLMIERLK